MLLKGMDENNPINPINNPVIIFNVSRYVTFLKIIVVTDYVYGKRIGGKNRNINGIKVKYFSPKVVAKETKFINCFSYNNSELILRETRMNK